jgi:uncharacterized coiled-coil protein SlyX
LAIAFLPLLLVSFLHSQSVAELAKKEKERRAALKGKSATVITTADLAKVKKRPAVESSVSKEQALEEAVTEAGAAEAGAVQAAGAAAAGQEAGTEQAAAGEAAAPPDKPVEVLPDLQPAAPSAKDVKARLDELTKAASEKQELVDLLNLKMNALYQQFHSVESIKSRETIQAQISDTYDKLLKAELDSAKAAKELEDFMAQAQKDKAPVIWIK